MSKPMREAMPTVAAWIDELRDAFGRDQIDPSIRNGMAGSSDFYARENGQEIGCKFTVDPNKTITLNETHVGPWAKPKKEIR